MEKASKTKGSARLVGISISILMVLSILAQPAYAPTKIAPTEAEPGKPFTVIDTPHGRLVNGTVAIFRTAQAPQITIPLRTHAPGMTAQGRLPSNITPGTYSVSFRLPNGTEVSLGTFKVLGIVGPTEPTITPVCTLVMSNFAIADSLGRMTTADRIIFSAQGEGPDHPNAVTVADAVFSFDGQTATGTVPSILQPAMYEVFVFDADPSLSPPLFNALLFLVLAGNVAIPCIVPASAVSGSVFTIHDPVGRMLPTDVVMFAAPDGVQSGATVLSVSADGTTLVGKVPVTEPGLTYVVTVRHSLGDDPIMPGFSFIITPP